MIAKIMLTLANSLAPNEYVVGVTSHEGYLFVVTNLGLIVRIERS